jgi:outer membrane protein OmpA-like peptidoglycan-associated protein
MIALSLLLIAQHVCAQTNLTEENADCYGAVEIRDSIFGPVFPGKGHGHISEILGVPEGSIRFIEEEHHSIWYGFRVPWDCELAFDIIPEDERDDIDFLLFPDTTAGTCADLYSGLLTPIRSNVSRNRPELHSRTGLSRDATQDFVGSGPSEHAYSRSVSAKKGDRFLLLIDQLIEPLAPYTIRLRYGTPPVEAEKEAKQEVIVSVRDSETGEPVAVQLTVDGLIGNGTMRSVGSSEVTLQSEPYRSLLLQCEKEGYLPVKQRTKGSADEKLTIEVLMTPLRPGVRVTWKDINFMGNKATILRSSKRALEELVSVMESNTELRIEIQGHVNGPGLDNTKKLQELSTARAKAVYMHLRTAGIHADRLEYAGYGNTEMINPEPISAKEEVANRRVEIKILDNGGFGNTMADSPPSSN